MTERPIDPNLVADLNEKAGGVVVIEIVVGTKPLTSHPSRIRAESLGVVPFFEQRRAHHGPGQFLFVALVVRGHEGKHIV